MYVLMFVTRLGDPDTVVMGVTELTTPKSQSTSSGEYLPKSLTCCSVVMSSQAKLV